MRHRRQQPVRVTMSLMLTPMLDMLTVVLIFLIVNFSPDKAKIKQSAAITLPKAQVNLESVPRIQLELTKEYIKINGKQVEGLSPESRDLQTWGALQAKLDEVTKAFARKNGIQDSKPEPILLIADREMPYEFLDRTVAHLAAGGYSEVFLLTNKGDLK